MVDVLGSTLVTSVASSIGDWTRLRRPVCRSARWKKAHRLPYFASVSMNVSFESNSRLSARTRRICRSAWPAVGFVTYLAIVNSTGLVEVEAPTIEDKCSIWGDDDRSSD